MQALESHPNRRPTKAERDTSARQEALHQIKAQARRDAKAALQSLRAEIEAFRLLPAESDEAGYAAEGFADRLHLWGSEAVIDTAVGCDCLLSYDCDADIGDCDIPLEHLQPIGAQVGYSRVVRVSVGGIASELHRLLVEIDNVIRAHEEL